jgi:hypothetical protein
MTPGHIRREIIAGDASGIAPDSRGACVLLEGCWRRACGAPATHVFRETLVIRGRGQRRSYQLCEPHAREAARQWRIELPEAGTAGKE